MTNLISGKEALVYGHGVNDFHGHISVKGKHIYEYKIWKAMLRRCYSERLKIERPTYSDCIVDDEVQSINDQYAEIEQVRQDMINHPSHYADSAVECIDAMEAMMTPEQFIGYLRGNLFKYQWRYEKKNGIEDLKKAQWYLEKLTVKIAEKNAPF